MEWIRSLVRQLINTRNITPRCFCGWMVAAFVFAVCLTTATSSNLTIFFRFFVCCWRIIISGLGYKCIVVVCAASGAMGHRIGWIGPLLSTAQTFLFQSTQSAISLSVLGPTLARIQPHPVWPYNDYCDDSRSYLVVTGISFLFKFVSVNKSPIFCFASTYSL